MNFHTSTMLIRCPILKDQVYGFQLLLSTAPYTLFNYNFVWSYYPIPFFFL